MRENTLASALTAFGELTTVADMVAELAYFNTLRSWSLRVPQQINFSIAAKRANTKTPVCLVSAQSDIALRAATYMRDYHQITALMDISLGRRDISNNTTQGELVEAAVIYADCIRRVFFADVKKEGSSSVLREAGIFDVASFATTYRVPVPSDNTDPNFIVLQIVLSCTQMRQQGV